MMKLNWMVLYNWCSKSCSSSKIKYLINKELPKVPTHCKILSLMLTCFSIKINQILQRQAFHFLKQSNSSILGNSTNLNHQTTSHLRLSKWDQRLLVRWFYSLWIRRLSWISQLRNMVLIHISAIEVLAEEIWHRWSSINQVIILLMTRLQRIGINRKWIDEMMLEP